MSSILLTFVLLFCFSSVSLVQALAPVAVIEVGNGLQHEKNDTAGSLYLSSSNVDHISQDMSSQRPLLVGDTIFFDGSGSFAPDGDGLLFQWDFGDRNDSTTNTSNPSHIYDEPGEYTVILVVTNSKDQAHLASTTVVVGNAPTALMLSPIEGDLFTVGGTLRLNAEGYDYQGNRILDDQMTWRVRQYHLDGFDFILDGTSGNDFELNVPEPPGDFMSAEIIFLRVILFVTDDNGLMTKVVTDVYPNITTTIDAITSTENFSMVDEVLISTPPDETNVKSRPTVEEIEPVRKPVILNDTNPKENDIKMSLASGNNEFDDESNGEEKNYAYALTPSWKWFICISMTLLLVSLIYFGSKYFQLKHELKTELNNSLIPGFHDKSMPPTSVEATSNKKEISSIGVIYSDETNVSSASATSNASFSIANTSFNKNATIWEKIAEETERRSKLRAKYSSVTPSASTTPRTPETMETRESLSNLDLDASPSRTLTTNIDETLVRLDDLLAKCFTRKLARSCRKGDSNGDSLEDGTFKTKNTESDSNIVKVESYALAPIWLSSNQKSTPGSPLRERSDDSFVEATFSMSSLYSVGSLQEAPNESHALHLLEVSSSTNQSLLIFQDTDLSTSNRGSSANESDINDSLMESGMMGDGERMTSIGLASTDEHDVLIGNTDNVGLDMDMGAKCDLSSSDQRLLLVGNVDDVAVDKNDLAGDGDTTTKNDLGTSSKEPQSLMGNADDLAENGDWTAKRDLATSSNERHVLLGNADLGEDGDMSTKSASFNERQLLIKRVNELIRTWADNDDRQSQ